jgi:2,4-dienoyl-CoA reductase-like NADH-dependent reductase (Old Yellow Enzyme family)
MSILFESAKIGKLEVKNRFVCSATLENMAIATGKVTEDLIKCSKYIFFAYSMRTMHRLDILYL